MVKKHSKAQLLACTCGRYYQWITDHPHPPDWRRNWPGVPGRVQGRVGLASRVSPWHTHCGQREHQPSPVGVLTPFPHTSFPFSRAIFWAKGPKQSAALSLAVAYAGAVEAEISALWPRATPVSALRKLSRESGVSLPQLTGGNAPRSPAQTPACGPVSLRLGGA